MLHSCFSANILQVTFCREVEVTKTFHNFSRFSLFGASLEHSHKTERLNAEYFSTLSNWRTEEMVITKEYRIVMPLTVDEYRIGQLWTVATFSKEQTGGGQGVEVLANEPFSNTPLLGNKYGEGQYTKKRYHGKKKVGGFIRRLLPETAMIAQEESWNAYPYTRTIITNEFLGDRFFLKIESLHLPGNASRENVHKLSPQELKNVEVEFIDIAEDLPNPRDYRKKRDPRLFKSAKTGRGKLKDDWVETTQPIMTCYKLVTVQFKWFGLQGFIERKIHSMQRRLFTLLHRELFCHIDSWYGLSLEQVREYEREVAEELNKRRKSAATRGLTDE